MTTNLYRFGFGKADGNGSMKELLGGKGAGLANMAQLGLPVPPGVTLPTSLCAEFMGGTDKYVFCTKLAGEVLNAYHDFIVPSMGFFPLLSVRSGARVSMPGMMDTILNVGITSANLSEWQARIGERAALDSYRRLIQMYAVTVHNAEGHAFEQALENVRKQAGAKTDADLTPKALEAVIAEFKAIFEEHAGGEFPDTLGEQLVGCIGAVFNSWNSERAIEYRMANKIPHDWGTAVTVQSMVFGNLNDQSATGVLFTRNPNSGEPGLFGEFLVNAQGEDVVAGIRTPLPLENMGKLDGFADVAAELTKVALGMEQHARDMQDMEFTVQDGKLFVLQTRTGKRSAAAAFRIAHDMIGEGLISNAEAVSRVTGKQYMALKRPTIDPKFKDTPDFEGLPAAGAVVTGKVVLTAEEAKAAKGPVVLVTKETTPDDFGGMMAAVGILTKTGGATSHAAVVARGMDKCCVVGASDMVIGHNIKAGDTVTLDGATGRVWVNKQVPVAAGGITEEAKKLLMLAKSGATESAERVKLSVNNWVDELPAAGVVVLDLTEIAANKRGRKLHRELLTELESRKDLRGVLEYLPEAPGTSRTVDKHLMDALGIAGLQAKPVAFDQQRISEVVGFSKWSKKLVARWIVSAPAGVLRTVAKERGFGIARHAFTLSDLLDGGAVTLTPELKTLLSQQGVAVDQITSLLEAAGKPVTPVPSTVDAETLVFAVFGK